MELKVWVEGIQRIVCGVTVNTTCQDVVFALAHATGKVGRFTLIERWRNNERLLAPNENPLKLLLKWGEYANDVQFILHRSEQNVKKPQHPEQQQSLQKTEANNNSNHNNIFTNDRMSQANCVMKRPLGLSNNNINNRNNSNTNTNSSNNNIDNATGLATQHKRQSQQYQKPFESNLKTTAKELRKNFGGHDPKNIENVGVVKGVPQRPEIPSNADIFTNSPIQLQRNSPQMHTIANTNLNINNINNNNIYAQIGPKSNRAPAQEVNLAEVRSSLDRRTSPCNAENIFTTPAATSSSMTSCSSNDNLLDIFNGNCNSSSSNNSLEHQQLYNNSATPTISANGALVPPPYRDPPPPRNSPLQPYKSSNSSDSTGCQNSPVCQNCNGSMVHDLASHGAGVCSNPFLSDYVDFDVDLQSGNVGMSDESQSIFQAAQYNDLLALIKFQREKISMQQSELGKYDSEIVYLENKERDQAQELEAISREITKADQVFRQGSEQLQTLQYVEEENELVKQQEKTLKSEIALLRSKLANCETELLQCKNKMRILMDDIEIEQRAISNKQKSNRQNVERDFLIEMERIQSEIDQAIHNTDTSNKTTENLKKEILLIENAIAEKKRQVEQLVNEMKEVNLQSLTVTTSEEIKHLLEGSNKPGSSRRIIGSPRQLENAVPTSKNPHGVWV